MCARIVDLEEIAAQRRLDDIDVAAQNAILIEVLDLLQVRFDAAHQFLDPLLVAGTLIGIQTQVKQLR